MGLRRGKMKSTQACNETLVENSILVEKNLLYFFRQFPLFLIDNTIKENTVISKIINQSHGKFILKASMSRKKKKKRIQISQNIADPREGHKLCQEHN